MAYLTQARVAPHSPSTVGTAEHPHPLRSAATRMVIGGAIGLLVFGIPFAAFGTIADQRLAVDLRREDGPFEWTGALAYLVAALLQLVLFWTSDVPKPRRVIPFLRRNPFYLGLATVLFLAFAEEISWGQRIIGWETPDSLLVENLQGETNIHNLAFFQGVFSVHFLFNVFWLSYCVVVPILAAAIPAVAALFRRIALPIPPSWIGGLFLGAFLAWRAYYALQPADAIADAQELSEAFTAMCFVALGAAQIATIQRHADPSPQREPAIDTPP